MPKASKAAFCSEKKRTDPRQRSRPAIHRRPRLSPALLHPGALEVARQLKQRGHETYFAGGCVRDCVLGVHPSDFDIATAASRRQVDAIFPSPRHRRRVTAARTLPGADDVIVDIISLGAPPWAERAQWRHQTKVEQSSPAEAFIKSFDYTINALYYDPANDVIIDFVNGVEDIRTRTLRLVRPTEFRLDVVSVLRGVTQCAKKDLRIDEVTWAAMCRWASIGDLRHHKPARIFAQMVKMLGSGVAAPCFEILERMGALKLLCGQRTIGNSEFARVSRLLAGLDRACGPGLAISALFATLFFHPIELALGRIGALPGRRRLSMDDWPARERALSDRIESNLRPAADPFAIPKAIYHDIHKTLLAVRLMREGRGAERWRDAREQPWWRGAVLLLEIVSGE